MPLLSFQPEHCESLFAEKAEGALARLNNLPISLPAPAHFSSAPSGYRLRAEFRVWHSGDDLNYVMFPVVEPRNPIIVTEFPIAGPRITATMTPLIERLRVTPELRKKLFHIEFLSTLREITDHAHLSQAAGTHLGSADYPTGRVTQLQNHRTQP